MQKASLYLDIRSISLSPLYDSGLIVRNAAFPSLSTSVGLACYHQNIRASALLQCCLLFHALSHQNFLCPYPWQVVSTPEHLAVLLEDGLLRRFRQSLPSRPAKPIQQASLRLTSPFQGNLTGCVLRITTFSTEPIPWRIKVHCGCHQQTSELHRHLSPPSAQYFPPSALILLLIFSLPESAQ